MLIREQLLAQGFVLDLLSSQFTVQCFDGRAARRLFKNNELPFQACCALNDEDSMFSGTIRSIF